MSVFDKLKAECEWAIKQIDDGKAVSVPETRSFFSLVLQTLKRMDRLNNKLVEHKEVKVMLKDALVRIAQLDENFKDPHYYLNYETDLDKVIKFYWFEKLGWCGCGTPEDAAKTVYKLLDAVKEKELEGRKAKLTEYFGVGSVYDNDLLLCLSYELDRAGFTDHGSSIGWAWLTEDGEYFRWALKEAIDKGELMIG